MKLPSISSWTTCLLVAITAANATLISSAHTSKSTDLAARNSPHAGFRNVGYYGDWKTYKNFSASDIPAERYTHLIYSFAKVDKNTGEVLLSDEYADLEKHFPGDLWDGKSNAYGEIKQMYLLKKKNRSLKTLLSIGGYTYSQEGQFEPMLASELTRSTFAWSAVQKMFDLGFDGLSLDYEYVSSPVECHQMIDLLKKIRTAMESYAKSTNSAPFIISYASPAGAKNYQHLDMPAMDKYIDQWDFMAYDYAGAWDTTSGHSSNLFANAENPSHTPFNTESAVDYYINLGKIAPGKINLGLPLYGHVFVQTKGPGNDYDKAASLQEGDKGSFLYKDIPSAANIVELPELGASYSYDAGKEYMVSYDTPNIARQKAKWIKEKGLGGAMFWEVSGDKTGDDSLVATVVKELGKLEKSKNHLSYPESQYENIKSGMKGEGEKFHAQDVGREDDEPAEPASQKAEESKATTTRVGAPTSPSPSISTPEPTTTQVEVVAESTPTVTATAPEPFIDDAVEVDDKEGNQEEGTEEDEEEGSDEKRNQQAHDSNSSPIFNTSKNSAKKSASCTHLAPTVGQFGATVAGTILIFLL